jgi:UDP-glucuronate 4-epimerase
MTMIDILENAIGKKARKNFLPLQPGDVPATAADIGELQREVGFTPSTSLEVGIPKFVEWFRHYYGK